MLTENSIVPDFSLRGIDEKGKEKVISLSDFKGKNIVIYFYPKDNTPGCTKEACSFRDKISSRDDTAVIGISKNSIESHLNFRKKYHLNFPILSDSEKEIALMFGAAEAGKSSISRQTFLLDKKGVLVKEWRKVKVANHSDEVYKAIEKL